MSQNDDAPVDVLVDGQWVPAQLISRHRGLDGEWRANVEFTLYADRDDPNGTRSLEQGPGRYPFTWCSAVLEDNVRKEEVVGRQPYREH